MRNFRFILRTNFLVAALFFAVSCGHLSRPELQSTGASGEQGKFVYQGEDEDADDDNPKGLSTPDEVMSSPEAIPHSNNQQVGPFRLQWPVARMKVNRGFSEGTGHDHLGLDIGGHKGDKIYAAHNGTVIYAGHGFRGYGNMVLLEFNQTWATLYGHMSRIRVRTGQLVRVGQVLGEMGRSGHATGVHLHFELIKNKNPVDPAPLLRGDSVARTL